MDEGYSDFHYLADQIETARFILRPFQHLYIENFLSDEHFASVVSQGQINVSSDSTQHLIDSLLESGWQVQQFPGCTTSVDEYLACYEANEWPVDKKRLEGFGLALRLKRYENSVTERLLTYLASDHFKSALEHKFGISRPNKIETAIHKYLSGYEISPHPDVRSKCLTYLANINPDPRSEKLSIHTHLLEFKDEKRFIYDFWRFNQRFETDWVPWEWCDSVTELTKNNSLVIFAPASDTLHAVKLRYDHLAFQRTQIYGNLWYTDAVPIPRITYEQFDLKPF